MWQFLAVIYLVGIGLLLKIGPVSQIYMLAIPVLAALLLGLAAGLVDAGADDHCAVPARSQSR